MGNDLDILERYGNDDESEVGFYAGRPNTDTLTNDDNTHTVIVDVAEELGVYFANSEHFETSSGAMEVVDKDNGTLVAGYGYETKLEKDVAGNLAQMAFIGYTSLKESNSED